MLTRQAQRDGAFFMASIFAKSLTLVGDAENEQGEPRAAMLNCFVGIVVADLLPHFVERLTEQLQGRRTFNETTWHRKRECLRMHMIAQTRYGLIRCIRSRQCTVDNNQKTVL
jgi:hypothetical protein